MRDHLSCVCGFVSTTGRRCRECERVGSITRLCPRCSMDEVDLCILHFHRKYRTWGCGCPACRRSEETIRIMRQIRRLILGRD